MKPYQLFQRMGGGAGGGGGPTVTTWNPADKGSAITLSSGNLTATGATSGGYANGSVRATASKATGKYYFEVSIDAIGAANHDMIGVCAASTPLTTDFAADALGYGYYMNDGGKWNNNSGTAYGAAYVAGDVIGVAFDASAGSLSFYKNNVAQGVAFTSIPAGAYFPAVALFGFATAPVISGRFKSADFSYTPPAGYSAWGI